MRVLIMLCLMIVFNAALAEEFYAKIIVVIDGDTVVIRRASGLLKIRLAEIDAPEKGQPFGEESKQSLSGMVLRKQVKVVSRAVDKYGRMVATLQLDGLDVNTEQVRRGMAWEYHSSKELSILQEEAKSASRGLWAQSNPIPPWDWRKQHPNNWSGPASAGGTQKKTTLPGSSCGKKRRCSQMSSCEEAKYYLNVCGIKTLDRNHDGVPCDKLCGEKKKR
jgi:endonuclease YncB( thermonuclease family)